MGTQEKYPFSDQIPYQFDDFMYFQLIIKLKLMNYHFDSVDTLAITREVGEK